MEFENKSLRSGGKCQQHVHLLATYKMMSYTYRKRIIQINGWVSTEYSVKALLQLEPFFLTRENPHVVSSDPESLELRFPFMPLRHSETTCTVWGLRAPCPLIKEDVISLKKALPLPPLAQNKQQSPTLSWFTILYIGGVGVGPNICSSGATSKGTHWSSEKYTPQMLFNKAWKKAGAIFDFND